MANFVDQTGGVGYGFGAKWPSAHATYLMSTVTPNALNGLGSTHTLEADLVINEGTGPFTVELERADITTLESLPALDPPISRMAWQPLNSARSFNNWVDNVAAGQWRNNPATGVLRWELSDVVVGAEITLIEVSYDGTGGHAFDPVTDPGGITMPSATLYSYRPDTGVRSLIKTWVNPVTNRALYQAPHIFSDALGAVAAGDKTPDATKRLELWVTSESGADYIADAECYGVRVTQDVAQIAL